MLTASPHQQSPFVGRDRELSILQARLAAAVAGRGSLVLVAGEAGVGKSALAARFCDESADAGAIILAGHCYDRTETPPYGPWIEIFALSATLAPPPSLTAAANQDAFFVQARDFLAALATARPLVLVLEDLHWADTASLDLLRSLARSLASLSLLLIVTYRDEEVDRRHPLAALVPLLVHEAAVERLNLRPLDATAARALVRARYTLAEPVTHRLATYLMERTEGNALFMTELLRTLAEERLLDPIEGLSYTTVLAQTPVPSLLKQIVDGRLSRLGDETAALLAAAAVVGQEVPLTVWEAVTRADEETLLAAAERAEAAHLIIASSRSDAIRFTHALIHDVLYEDVPALRRRRIHRQVAEVLAASPSPDPDAVTYHFRQAGDERAARWLVRAGERAEDAYALVTAAARYEAAFRLLDTQQGDPAERGWLRLLAAALRRYEDWDQAFGWVEEAVQLAATAGDASLIARVQALFGLLLIYQDDYHTAVATIAAALDMIDRLPLETGTTRREQQIDKHANRGILITLLLAGGRLTEARRQGENHLARFAESATTPGERGAIANAHTGLAMAYARLGEPDLARRSFAAAVAAYQASDDHVSALVSLRQELVLSVLPYRADDLAERERVAAEAERMAAWVIERGGHPNPHLQRYGRIPLLVLEGRWREARQILAPDDTADHPYLSLWRTYYLGTIARAQGDAETAWRCVQEAGVASPGKGPGEQVRKSMTLEFHLLLAELALDAEDLPAARSWLDLHRRWLDFMDSTLGRAEGEVLEAAWHRAAGDLERAREHADRALAHATTPRQPLALIAAHRLLGTLATDAGQVADAERHLAESLTLADACRAPHERALTLLAQAELAVAQRGIVAATGMLDEIRTICTPMDAHLALAQADRIAARLTHRDAPITPSVSFPAGLSTREVEVLRLVAAGLSNTVIAERLFLSPSTVKVHVANIFAKLGVNNRAAATRFAVDHGLV